MYFSAEDTEQLGKILVRDWSAANDKIVGIPGIFLFESRRQVHGGYTAVYKSYRKDRGIF